MDSITKDHPQYKQGYLYALRLLTASKKSEKEVAKRLKEKGYHADAAVLILDSLKEHGLLDDRKMVHETVQWQKQAKRYGKRRIELDLKKKGITQAVISEALSDYSVAEELETAQELAQVRWGKLAKLEPQKRKKRLFDYLVGRGFEFEIVREVVNSLNNKKTDEDF